MDQSSLIGQRSRVWSQGDDEYMYGDIGSVSVISRLSHSSPHPSSRYQAAAPAAVAAHLTKTELRILTSYRSPLFTWCFYRAMPCIRGTIAMALCPSVTSRCSIETDERIELVFSMWASFHPSYTVLKGNSVSSKNKGTSLWNFVLNSGLRKFRHSKSSVYRWYQQLVRGRFVYDTYRTMKATRSRHG